VDVGANHPKRFSKTWYLEKRLGWSGLAVEPLQQFAAEYATERPRTRFRSFFVSNTSDQAARLYVISDNTLVASGDASFTGAFGKVDRVDTVPTITLNDLLPRENIVRIDFLNMDIELHEPKALEGFDIRRFRPTLVCIEGLLPVRQQILEYFARNGYVLIGKYLRADQENLYFTPLTE
jgi:FkbM family methyltransferase